MMAALPNNPPTAKPGAAASPSPLAAFSARACRVAMAGCMAVMSVAVFVNVVLRYGFGTGVAGSEELARLLFVWMVFIGATLAYPAGEHMAFDSLLAALGRRPAVLAGATLLIRLLVLLACALLGWGAWQQVVVGLGSRSVVLGYPSALLPLPALLCALAIGAMAALELLQRRPLRLGQAQDVE
jgi:gluconokinase